MLGARELRMSRMPSKKMTLQSLMDLRGCSADNTELELLSSKGKILAAMLQHSELTVKEIPHLAGVSFRTCFQQIRFLEQIGVVEKSSDPLDKRRAIVKLNVTKISIKR